MFIRSVRSLAYTGDQRIQVDYAGLAQRVLDGHVLTEAEGLAILATPDEELLELMAAAYRIRRHYFGNTVHLHFLINAKSGLCPEDCSYCSQSRVSRAEIPKYNLLNREQLLDGARVAAERGSRTYCIVISARSPNERELREVEALVPEIKRQYGVRICTSLGLLNDEQARRLKACGVDRINHNVNTSEEYYAEICSTHSYRDRVETLRAVREAGLEICSGGIIGMGERDIDVVHMALELRQLNVQSIPINFLHPIAGTPLADLRELEPATLPEDIGAVPLRQSLLRAAHGRRPRTAPGQHAVPGTLRRQFAVRRRLSHHQGTAARSRLPHARRNGLRDHRAGSTAVNDLLTRVARFAAETTVHSGPSNDGGKPCELARLPASCSERQFALPHGLERW